MTEPEDQRPAARRKARDLLSGLSHRQREELLVGCWLSHDARWYMAAAQALGLEVANRLNQAAARAEGRAEARRVVRALGLGPIATLDEWLTVQEVLGALLVPDLLDYQVIRTGEGTYELRIRRCFAHENVTRAGIGDAYECGILARVAGWLDALNLQHELSPLPGKCPRVQGHPCVYTFRVRAQADSDTRGLT